MQSDTCRTGAPCTGVWSLIHVGLGHPDSLVHWCVESVDLWDDSLVHWCVESVDLWDDGLIH